ncbi:MAG: (2Fe-2S) ferredoxin domain-containing protein [Bacteroidales bacterium]|nr:(2Fe-2S) ferredoxin domain-containing protein [Bacteroidales bacterium]
MNNKIEVVICLGSSCFARGNKTTLKVIDKYLKDNNLIEKVFFHGGHCFGKCAEGPVVKIDDEIYTGVTELSIIDILNNKFKK